MSGDRSGAPGSYPYRGTLGVAPELLDRLVALCRDGLPNEACGLVAGRGREVSALYPLTNLAQSAERYGLDPLEQLDAYYEIVEADLEPIGVYHSHPATPARPSAADIAEAYDPEAAYVIVSLAEREPTVRAFSIREGGVSELTLVIHPAADAATNERKDG
ncbi:MAG: M67 family metallopeptidase [Coriobacteriia bacterium]